MRLIRLRTVLLAPGISAPAMCKVTMRVPAIVLLTWAVPSPQALVMASAFQRRGAPSVSAVSASPQITRLKPMVLARSILASLALVAVRFIARMQSQALHSLPMQQHPARVNMSTALPHGYLLRQPLYLARGLALTITSPTSMHRRGSPSTARHWRSRRRASTKPMMASPPPALPTPMTASPAMC